MIVEYKNKKLQKNLKDPKYLAKHFDKKEAMSISKALIALDENKNLSGLFKRFRCHLLKGDLSGHFAMDIPSLGRGRGNKRLILLPVGNDRGETDKSKISHIKILSIEDYHK